MKLFRETYFLEVIWSTSIIFLAPLCEPTPARLCNWSGTKSIQFSCKSLSVDDKSTSSAKRSGHTCQAQILDQMVENHIWAVHVSRFSLMGQASQPVFTKWEFGMLLWLLHIHPLRGDLLRHFNNETLLHCSQPISDLTKVQQHKKQQGLEPSTSYSTRAPQTTPHPQHHTHHLSTIAIPPVQQRLDQLWHFVRTKRSTNRSRNSGTAQMLAWRVGVPEFGALS